MANTPFEGKHQCQLCRTSMSATKQDVIHGYGMNRVLGTLSRPDKDDAASSAGVSSAHGGDLPFDIVVTGVTYSRRRWPASDSGPA